VFNKLRLMLPLFIAVIGTIMLGQPDTAYAYAYETSFKLTCTGLLVSGTSGSPYIGVIIRAGDNSAALVDSLADEGVPAPYYTVTDGKFSFSLNFPAQPEGTWFYVAVYSANAKSFGAQDSNPFIHHSLQCTNDNNAPSIPSGFVLRTITCHTPVFNMPGGSALSSGERVTAGQTWFVSPNAVKDIKGRAWTEIFNSGWSNGFIPTACVGGRPAGYFGQ